MMGRVRSDVRRIAGLIASESGSRTATNLPRRGFQPALVVFALAIASGAHAADGAADNAGLAAPQVLLELSKKVPVTGDFPVQVLLEETWLRFDAAGRCARTDRVVYRIDSNQRKGSCE